ARIDAITLAVEACIEAIALAREPVGERISARFACTCGARVEAVLDAVTARVQVAIDAIAPAIEPRVDAIALSVETSVDAIALSMQAVLQRIL
ncbi:MAG: hypothetical protein GTO67_11220, partial [Gammaproteobacteria bacterium]|nr:hypothetical protein [Gammaproteobacteria bacterium]NIM72263.1 hypothetical protein [Gammaproteobacteria bacterium]NIN39178.1 hypothetical protein [Gammaproteobacteria bacterium]NIO24011.1 hypothetical protein [Gammaproteobacteria bacterium]NIO64663.1 hypothetical protein [Gammaproteobacteria bacterium]